MRNSSSHAAPECDHSYVCAQALGKLSGVRGRISARLQGPYGGANLEAAEQQRHNSLLVITGGAGLTSALASLQRCAIQRHFAKEGAHHLAPLHVALHWVRSTWYQSLGTNHLVPVC